jgi:hypothetical protein
MDEVAVDIEQAGAVILPVDDVVVENLVVERLGRSHGSPPVSFVVSIAAAARPEKRANGS